MASNMIENPQNSENNSDDLPQEITESYGTGVKDIPGYNIGGRTLQERRQEYTQTSPELTGGDVDAYWQNADSVGEEAVGGTVATPDQNITEEIAAAVGIEIADHEILHTQEMLITRDDVRWELDPTSAEDYEERQ